MTITKNGTVFKFNIKAIRRGSWVVEVVSINGDPENHWWGELGSEREARASARDYAASKSL